MFIQELGVVASMDKPVTGVAITKNRRMFFSMPTFEVKDNYNVGEWVDGDVKKYNAGNLKCVTSVHTEDNDLYLVDEDKLVIVDTTTDKISKVFRPNMVEDSKLNDVRVVGRTALISEYNKGSVIVLDMSTGRSRQVLLSSKKAKAPKTTASIYGNKISGEIHVDGIELSPDKKTFYFTFPLGGAMWSVAVDDLLNPTLTASQLNSRVKKFTTLPATGGLVTLSNGEFLVSNAEKCSIDILDKDGKLREYIKPSMILQWPDALMLDGDYAYFACSQLDSSPLLNPGEENKMHSPFNVFRIKKPIVF